MIQLCSMFRDSADYVTRYMRQVRELRNETDVRLIVAEGDSTDNTYGELQRLTGHGDTLLKVDHGGPAFASVDTDKRWRQISRVLRAIFEKLDPALPTIWVEADLIWDPKAMLGLLADLERVPAVAPMIMADQRTRFYDVWGYRIKAEKFKPFYPLYEGDEMGDDLVKIDSCGSCFAVRDTKIVKEWNGLWPFRAQGTLWLDPRIIVDHPPPKRPL